MNQKVEFIESYIKVGNGDYQWNDNHGELIRCNDCRHNPQNGAMPEELPYWFPCKNRQPEPNWFCADGVAKDKEDV